MLIEITASCSRLKLESQKLDVDAEIEKAKSEMVENAITAIRQNFYEHINQKGYMQIELKLKMLLVCGENFEKLSSLVDNLLEIDKDLGGRLLDILK